MARGDLIGQTINELTILDEYWHKNATYCKVKCSCGEMFNVRKDSVKSGNTKSCGHLALETQFQSKDITSKKFGRLTAIKSTDKKSGNATIWLCECSCGNEKEVPIDLLESGKTRSCGCLLNESSNENIKKAADKLKDKYVDDTFIYALQRDTLLKNNRSGVTGVFFDKSRQKWVAKLEFQGEVKLNKRFTNKEDAIKARKAAEDKYFKPFLEKLDK